jgi:hypothetical protein
LDDFDSITVGIVDKEAIAMGDGNRFFDRHTESAKMIPGFHRTGNS